MPLSLYYLVAFFFSSKRRTTRLCKNRKSALFAALLTANAMALVNQDNKKEAEKMKKQDNQNIKTKPQARAA